MKRLRAWAIFLALLVIGAAMPARAQQIPGVTSPDGHLVVSMSGESDGAMAYAVQYKGATVLEPSPLGLTTDRAIYTITSRYVGAGEVEKVTDDYTLVHGKRLKNHYEANRRLYRLAGSGAQGEANLLEVEFQVSNHGVAFRYLLNDTASVTSIVRNELTGFDFPENSRAWITPMTDAKTFWSRTNPSYEYDCTVDMPVGTPSEFRAGWSFPALFRVEDRTWVLISETGLYDQYCATRLAQSSPGGLYRIAFPEAEEALPEFPVSPRIALPWASPWRTIDISDNLGDIVESSLATDLAEPSIVADTSWIKPGQASWSWLPLKDPSMNEADQRKYIDFASRMGWRYTLIDSLWDKELGYDLVAQLVRDAAAKGVDLLLWYNTNGTWNDAPMTPKNRMHTAAARREEMQRLSAMGIKGIKVDFFGGDKQDVIRLYMDIMRDAAEYRITTNFHGATLPRGWQRTFPNLMTTEAVKGTEFTTFEQVNADTQAVNCAVHPFARNVVAPMDYTPVWFPMQRERVRRRTSDAFEIALAVLFESGIQHYGLRPETVDAFPGYVTDYFKTLPPTWDDIRFIDGYPGRYVVLARRAGVKWWVAGINAQDTVQSVKADLSFIGGGAVFIADGEDGEGVGFQKKDIPAGALADFAFAMPSRGGFVLMNK